MLGHRIRKAKQKARKRFKHWYPDYDPNKPLWVRFDQIAVLGALRKNSTVCSCEMCCNPRRSTFTPKHERPTVQERRAVTIQEGKNHYGKS